MKKLFVDNLKKNLIIMKTPKIGTVEIDHLIETFSHTHQSKDLKALLSYTMDHFEWVSLITLRQFLYDIQKERFIRQKVLTDLLYHCAIQMISHQKINRGVWLSEPFIKELKLCVGIMLKLTSTERFLHPQRFWDYLYWQVFTDLAYPGEAGKIFFRVLAEFLEKILHREIGLSPLFLQLLIAYLGVFLRYSKFNIEISPAQNKFVVYQKIFYNTGYSFKSVIYSKLIEKVIRKIPPLLNDDDLNRLVSLFNREIHYQKFGQLTTVQIPFDDPCWKIIRRILDCNLTPIIVQNQQNRITEISKSLYILPLVLILLICEYYNNIDFLRIQANPSTRSHSNVPNPAVRLFYLPSMPKEEPRESLPYFLH
jgi:hypothetical protein